MIKLMTIFCMAGILTVNPAIVGLAEEESAVGAEPVAEEEESEEEAPVVEAAGEAVLQEPKSTETQPEVSVQEAEGTPVVMAAEADTAQTYKYTIYYNDANGNHTGADTTTDETINLSLPADKKRDGYEFLGFFKGEDRTNLYTEGSTYKVQEEDYKKELIFYGVWRKEITVTADEQQETPQKTSSTPTAVTYQLPSATAPKENYQFAGWMINGHGPVDSLTLNFNDQDNNCIFNVSADGNYGIEAGASSLSLRSCWNPKEGYSDFLIKNATGYDEELGIKAGSDEEKKLSKDQSYHASVVNDTAELTFATKGWSFSKKASELTTGNTSYVEKDGHYYKCKNLDITRADFEKTVTITYEDTYEDTTFSPEKSITNTIHPGVKRQTWKSLLTKNIEATRGTYQFAEWKYFLDNEDITTQIETQEIAFKDHQTLVVRPVWKGTYSYNANVPEDAYEVVKVPERQSEFVEKSVTLLRLDDITGKYTFAGWKDSEGQLYPEGSSYIVTKAAEIFAAQWKKVSHQIMFVDGDGKVLCKGAADYNTRISWPEKPEKEGYTFQNWVVKIKNENQPVNHGDEFAMPAQDLTFTAQWSINSYKISYDGNGAAMGVPAETVEQNYQTDYTIDTVVPTKTGYTFQGWSDGTTTYQPGAVFKVPARDVVLTAQWKANSHQVKYDGNGGKTSAPESKSADYNSNVSVAAGLEKDGYLFDGWEQISTGKVLTPGASFVMPDMDETLKAKWKIAYTGINGKGTFYLVSGQSYTLGAGLKVQGDNSSYSGNMTFYVPQSGYYTFE